MTKNNEIFHIIRFSQHSLLSVLFKEYSNIYSQVISFDRIVIY